MSAESAFDELRRVIEKGIRELPRTRQQRIGASEIGNACDRCLASKIANLPRYRSVSVPWFPLIGTAVHAQLEQLVTKSAVPGRYVVEASVTVGQIGGEDVRGTSDVVDLQTGMVIDYKVVGDSTLRSARRGPSQQYRIQAHLYAKGWAEAGIPIKHVAIAYLPRNQPTLDAAVFWTEPYKPKIALEALGRANELAERIEKVRSSDPDRLIFFINALKRAGACWTCLQYPENPLPVTR